MKPVPFGVLLLAGALALPAAGHAAASKTAAVVDNQLGPAFQQAVRLLESGQDREAEPLLRHLQRRHPNHPTVRHLLQQIEERRARDTGAALRSELQKLILPRLDVRDADPAVVIDYLRVESAKLTADRQPVNIVVLAPSGARSHRITLSLREVSLFDALRFAAEAAGLELRVETHAVVLDQPAAPAPASPAHAEP
ncbi:hypothetical protein HQ590_13675 [bacterium]|nr:hypothetical protein [bacterium]